MNRPSTSSAPPSLPPPPRRVGECIRWAATLIRKARLSLDNGMQTPREEANYLVCHALGIPFEEPEPFLDREVPAERLPVLLELLRRRIQERRPAAYLTHEAFFAGHRFYVDERVLIPRSRIENIFDDPVGLAAFLPPAKIRRALDLCTGSGCLAVMLALTLPHARVTASDLSAEALTVAAINRREHGLENRIQLVQSDLFTGLGTSRFDLILTNPPYVPRTTWERLPPEYHREPALALLGGEDGLDLVARLLLQAPDHLTPEGVLICEVGDQVERILMRRWPDFPGEWIQFHFGASGVFAIQAPQLREWLSAHAPAQLLTPPPRSRPPRRNRRQPSTQPPHDRGGKGC